MKKNPANRSAFLQSRAMVAFATCAFAAFLTLLAYALAPGGRVQAAPQGAQHATQAVANPIQQQSGQPDMFANLQHFPAVVDSIIATPMDEATLRSLAPEHAETLLNLSRPQAGLLDDGTAVDRPLPIEPAQATASPSPAGAAVILDTRTSATGLSLVNAITRTHMGDGFRNTVIPGPTTYVQIRSFTCYMVATTATTYNELRLRIAFWSSYVAANTPVFTNSAGAFEVPLTGFTTAANTIYTVNISVLAPFPFFNGGPGTQWGWAQNWQGCTTGAACTPVDSANLTSLITSNNPGGVYFAGEITSGTAPVRAWYSDQTAPFDFNFAPGDLFAFGTSVGNGQGIGIIIRGDPQTGPTPTPGATGTPGPTGTPSPTPGPTGTPLPPQCTPSEGFDDITNLVIPKQWVMTNLSNGVGSTGWFQGSTAVFDAHSGPLNSYIGANFNNTGAVGTISNWLLTPPVTLQNGGILSFYTRTVDTVAFPDRLQVRYSTNGTSSNVGASETSVGDFTNLVLDINPTLTTAAPPAGYPNTWTNYTVNLSGLGIPITGRFAFRYFVDGGGSAAPNSDFIGIDTVTYTCAGPTPTPAPTNTPAPTPSPQPTGTPSPTCPPVITLSSSQTITAGNSASCNNGIGHTDNSYWRAFNMAGFTASQAYNVTSVSFGIEEASTGNVGAGTPTPTPGGPGTQPVTVRLYTNAGGAFPLGTRTQIATTTVNVPDQSLAIFTAPLVVTVPAGTSELIMEVFTPDGEPTGNLFYIGSNAATQGGPTYISATDCGLTNPTDTAAINFPDMHAVMNVNGACAPTPTPTAPPTVNISGRVANCSSPAPTATPPAVPTPPVLPGSPNVLMTLSGSSSGTTLTDASGNYSFTVAGGGTYTVTPTKTAIPPAGPNINNLDVLATQRHFLLIAIIPTGCRLTAADANVSGGINNQDVLAVQRFFLGFTSGIGSVGQYRFVPASRSYPAIGANQTNQNYELYVIGDPAASYNNRPGSSENDIGFSNVANVALPQISAEQSRSNFTAPVTSSVIDKQDRIVGFQGDFTFDERVVTFATEPVQKAGLTGGNWSVAGNVLPGAGPIRTLRVSAYSSDFAPLSGAGTLFELKVVNAKSGGTTPLAWAAAENGFLYMDAVLNTQRPGNSVAGAVNPPSKR